MPYDNAVRILQVNDSETLRLPSEYESLLPHNKHWAEMAFLNLMMRILVGREETSLICLQKGLQKALFVRNLNPYIRRPCWSIGFAVPSGAYL